MTILSTIDIWPIAVLEKQEIFCFSTGYHEVVFNGYIKEKYFERSRSLAYREFIAMKYLPRRDKKIK